VTKPELSDPIALRIPLDVLAQIEAVAAATERTRSWIMVRALRYYLGGEGSEILAAIEGRRQIADGKSHEMDDVIAEIDALAEGRAA
jgi:predicted transcriptional regulator